MFKLIVDSPKGIQEIVEVDKSGGYFDESLVVWDERLDGPISPELEAQVGGLKRAKDGSMSFDQGAFDEQDTIKKDEESVKLGRDQRLATASEDLIAIYDRVIAGATLNASEIQTVLRALVISTLRR